jgi:glycosyltransferase involved in cell wall biosynthesis
VRHAVFIVPGRLDARTGGSIYNHRMVAALRRCGWAIDVHELSGAFPTPSAEAVAAAAALLATIADDTIVVIDGLAYGAMPDVVLTAGARLRLVALVHMLLAHEVGIDRISASRREADERRALSAATAVIVTGRTMVDPVSAHGIGIDRIAVVSPGIDRAPIAHGSDGSLVRLLCVAALTPGKGHDVLLQALAANHDRAWHLTCVGSTTRSPATTAMLREMVDALNLSARVSFIGQLAGSLLDASFEHTDLFVLPTFRETFGMAVAEALARGIPVVATATGEIPFLVGSDAGVVVPVGNLEALTGALTEVLADSAFRSKLRAGAIQARDRLSDWDDAAARMSAVLERVAGGSIARFNRSGRE